MGPFPMIRIPTTAAERIQSLVQSLIQLRGLVKSRNQWIGALLAEIARPRLNPFPRSLEPHEAEFLNAHRPKDNGSSS